MWSSMDLPLWISPFTPADWTLMWVESAERFHLDHRDGTLLHATRQLLSTGHEALLRWMITSPRRRVPRPGTGPTIAGFITRHTEDPRKDLATALARHQELHARIQQVELHLLQSGASGGLWTWHPLDGEARMVPTDLPPRELTLPAPQPLPCELEGTVALTMPAPDHILCETFEQGFTCQVPISQHARLARMQQLRGA